MGHAGPSQLPRRLYRRAALRRPCDHAGIDVGHGVYRNGAPGPPRHADARHQSDAISDNLRQRCQHGRAGAAGRAVLPERRQHRLDYAHRRCDRRIRRRDAEQRGGPAGAAAYRGGCRHRWQSDPSRGRLRNGQSGKHLQPDALSAPCRSDRNGDTRRAGDVHRSQHEPGIGTVYRNRRQQRFAARLRASRCRRRGDGRRRAGRVDLRAHLAGGQCRRVHGHRATLRKQRREQSQHLDRRRRTAGNPGDLRTRGRPPRLHRQHADRDQ